MSKSIAEIHNWLYNKILLSERNEKDIVEWANNEGLPGEEWISQAIELYGKPTGGKPLKEVIKPSNIHIGLYEKVKSAELRLAALVTRVLSENPAYKGNLVKIFEAKGVLVAREYQGVTPNSPEEMYIILNDYLLDGMPTDRVNEVLSGNDNVIIWRTTTCLHKPYWDEVKGDVQHYYDLREAWIKSFVETVTPDFTYEKRPTGNHKIMRKLS